LDDGANKERTYNLSNSLSNNDIESEYDEGELDDENDIVTSSKSTPCEEDISFTKYFMNIDLDDLDNFGACISTSLGELVHVASKSYAPGIYIKDKDHEFNIDSEIIEIVEASKIYGKDIKLIILRGHETYQICIQKYYTCDS
jgi:hypothetical protein